MDPFHNFILWTDLYLALKYACLVTHNHSKEDHGKHQYWEYFYQALQRMAQLKVCYKFFGIIIETLIYVQIAWKLGLHDYNIAMHSVNHVSYVALLAQP